MAGSATLDQRRAAHAWKAVEAVAANPKADKAKYGIHSKKLPSRIVAAGLGQALAFLLAKNYCPDLLQALSHWVLNKKEYPAPPAKLPAADTLLRTVVNGDSDMLRLHTEESLAYLQWLVRFVEAQGLGEEE